VVAKEQNVKYKYIRSEISTSVDTRAYYDKNLGPRGSTSPVLTATGVVNGRWRFSTPYRIDTA